MKDVSKVLGASEKLVAALIAIENLNDESKGVVPIAAIVNTADFIEELKRNGIDAGKIANVKAAIKALHPLYEKRKA